MCIAYVVKEIVVVILSDVVEGITANAIQVVVVVAVVVVVVVV